MSQDTKLLSQDNQNMGIREVAAQCMRAEAEAVLQAIPQLDEAVDRAVAMMLDCKGKVVVTGVGKSGHIGAKIAATLSSTGTPSVYLNPLDAFHGDLGMLSEDDVVVALSNSGQTDELLRIVPFLKEHHIPIIGISGNRESLLAKHSDIHIYLHVAHEACPLDLAPTSSTTAQLALGDALAVVLMERRHFEARDFAQFHPGGSLGRRLLMTARDVMRTEELPTVATTMPLSEAVICVSHSRLGLVVAVEDDKVVGIVTDGDVRRAMERLRQDFFNVSVGEVMTKSPRCVNENMKISDIQRIMNKHKIHAVLVTDSELHLIGIVDSFSCEL